MCCEIPCQILYVLITFVFISLLIKDRCKPAAIDTAVINLERAIGKNTTVIDHVTLVEVM